MTNELTLPRVTLAGLTADSRKVQPGYLFAAIPGTAMDGRQFIGDAISRGATAVLAPPDISSDDVGPDVTLVTDANPRRRLARMAAEFYAPQPEHTIAVTGTNGKTSVASFTRQLWEKLGNKAAYIGTLGIRADGFDHDGGLTTPDPVDLHELLHRMKTAGIDHVAMEASSHGLDMHRLDGLTVQAAAFTNLTRDHLDYHGSMEAYRAAKLRLFEELLVRGGTAVVNTGAQEYDRIANIASERRQKILSYGLNNGQLRTIKRQVNTGGFDLEIDILGTRHTIDFPLPGLFQIENALAALGLVIASGADPNDAAPLLSGLEGVPGRLQPVANLENGASVYVDYAHTPDALSTVLTALRPHASGNLHVVFGCGGDRDKGKRPMMGGIAKDLADTAIVTDDNPRSENPAAIRREILEACPGAADIGDRKEAIYRAMKALKPGDVLCVAGKGHEQGQTIGDKVIPFDDATCVKQCADQLTGSRTT